MRATDILLILATAGAFIAVEAHNRVEISPAAPAPESAPAKASLITCPLRKPEFATVMQAAMLGDGTLIVEQQTNTRVRHVKDC
ncbi:hypothetical protein MWN33_09605 [Starkeya koreensis]|uniref:Secreted protein n=1 Tax=Ancylobacter koreensis TaxID=266121 RepID=A0ABT0DLY4_9HYPH|nr:hypothetical protein [Ancylobacter koreensis]MCK0208286.1 hypothetical protein [Ancylobacter koreensis]